MKTASEREQALAADLLYLIGCSVRGENPREEFRSDPDQDALWRLSSAHTITAMAAIALEQAGLLADWRCTQEQREKWEQARMTSVYRRMCFDTERESIFRCLEDQKIWYAPLKGIYLQALYPRYEMREMADNDILYDASRRKDVQKIMKERGYQLTRGRVHDGYRKDPLYNFEMHEKPFGSTFSPLMTAYYETLPERLQWGADQPFRRSLPAEDHFVYVIAHAYKHYLLGGFGLRTLVDIYLLLRAQKQNLDWGNIEEQWDKLEIREFGRNVCSLSEKLLSSPVTPQSLTEAEQELFSRTVCSGTYGTQENLIETAVRQFQPEQAAISKRAKRKYLRERLFPSKQWMIAQFEFCEKHPKLIPVYHIYRVFRMLCHPRKTLREIRAVDKLR